MPSTNKTVLDHMFSEYTVPCQIHPAIVAPDELVHVVGAQEPIREQPDARARMLLTVGWLKVELVRTDLPDSERTSRVSAVQQAARAWLKQSDDKITAADRDQVRWLIEKTRSYESKQQIAQRVWLALVLYSLDCRDWPSTRMVRPFGRVVLSGGWASRRMLRLTWPGHKLTVRSTSPVFGSRMARSCAEKGATVGMCTG
jgi:hypothetical protein